MLTVVGAILCVEANHTKMMQSFAFHSTDLIGLKPSSQKAQQSPWLKDLKELSKYVQRVQPRALSVTNRKLFEQALTHLTNYSFQLFNTAQLVYNMEKPNFDLLKKHHDILKTELEALKKFKTTITSKFSDYKKTKEIKQTLVTIYIALEGIYEKAIDDLSELRATARLNKDMQKIVTAWPKGNR